MFYKDFKFMENIDLSLKILFLKCKTEIMKKLVYKNWKLFFCVSLRYEIC